MKIIPLRPVSNFDRIKTIVNIIQETSLTKNVKTKPQNINSRIKWEKHSLLMSAEQKYITL